MFKMNIGIDGNGRIKPEYILSVNTMIPIDRDGSVDECATYVIGNESTKNQNDS